MSECQALLGEVHAALEKNGESYVRQCGFVYQIHIKNASNELALSDFTLDLKHGSGFLRPGMDSQADVFLSIVDEDMVAMAKGNLSTFNALRDGRLIIKGDQLASHVLSEIMERIQREKRNTLPRPEPQSDEVTLLWRLGAVCGCCLLVLLALVMVNPWEVKRSSGGPRELEKVAHMSDSSIQRLNDGAVMKIDNFTSVAFSKLFLPMKGPKAMHPLPLTRPSDVFLVGVPGSGTTWLSHIMHGLRSDGSMSFEDILQVVAWWETLGFANSLAAQSLSPRLFFSHRFFGALPSNVRYVVLMREPLQVLQSQYAYFCNSSWAELAGLKPGEMNLNLFTSGIFARVNRNEVWRYIVDWYQCCWTKPEALWITYEDFAADPATQIRKLGRFLLANEPGQETIRRVVQQSSRDFMLEHEAKFDKHFLLDQIDLFKRKDGSRARLPRIRADASMEIHPLTVEFLEVRWTRIVTPVTGFRTYEEMRYAIQQRQLHAASGSLESWLPRSHGMSHFLFATVLLTGLLLAFIGLQPTLARSLATRLWIQGRSQYRRSMSHFLDSKKTDPELKAGKTSAGGFIV